jgi:putative ABC transport system ATP-binding protein
LLGILAGLDLPSHGRVFLVDHELTSLDEEQRALARGKHVGFVFQTFQLLRSLTALENVMLPGELRGDADAKSEALNLLDKVGLGQRTTHYPTQLSGGEQQRVAIARAFASRPSVLFADEPTGNLDTATGQRIIDLIFELNDEFSTTLMLVTHDDRLATRCQRVIEIDGGRIIP